MAKKVLDAAMHYIESMRSDANSWYKMQECYALIHQAKAIYERAQAMQDYAIPQNIVESSKHFEDPLTIMGVGLVFSLIVGLYVIRGLHSLKSSFQLIYLHSLYSLYTEFLRY